MSHADILHAFLLPTTMPVWASGAPVGSYKNLFTWNLARIERIVRGH